jgi:hypothetical protein
MLVTEDGMLTEARDVQPWKAACSMLVTDDGMLTVAKDVQPSKA